jgi:hypothetical protein
MFAKRIVNVCENLGLCDYSVYSHDSSWYGLAHMLKLSDVLSNTLYNMSTIIRGGDHDRS